jgi:oligopeptide transport system ATP-binding protein
MYLGRIIETGATEAVFDHPRHPYTAALMSASPKLAASGTRRDRIVLQRAQPTPLAPPPGCRFRTRCWTAQDICADVSPEPRVLAAPDGTKHVAECHFPLDSIKGLTGAAAPAAAVPVQ